MHCSRDIAACVDGLRAQITNASRGWSSCHSDSTIFPQQVMLLHRLLSPLYDRHGFAAAQLCCLYVADGMLGNHESKSACSLTSDHECDAGPSCLASSYDKNYGLPPCVCSALERQFGPAPMRLGSGMDLHPWGMFLADRMLDKARDLGRPPLFTEVSEHLSLIKQHMLRWIDEEPLHGFLWRTLAADRGVSSISDPATYAHQACALFYNPGCQHSCRECAHGIGHGLYHRMKTINSAIEHCVSLAHSSSNGSMGWSHILRDMSWKMACADGAFHSWFNSMTWRDQQPALQAKEMNSLCENGQLASQGEARVAWSKVCLLTYLPTYLLTDLLTYLLTDLPTYLLTDLPTYLPRVAWSKVCREALGFDGAQERLALAQRGECGRRAPSAIVLGVALSRIHNGTSVDITASGIELLSTLPSSEVHLHMATLVALLTHPEEDLRAVSLMAVAKHSLAEHEARLLPHILTGLRDSAWVVREAATEAAGQLTSAAVRQHLDALQPLLTDDNRRVRDSARAALSLAGVS